MMTEDLTLEEIATQTGLPLRTLRYYIAEGILQGPDTRGKYASYSQQHLDRIELIKRLKRLHLPLQEIRHLLENMSPDDISTIRQYQDILKLQVKQPGRTIKREFFAPPPQSSALDYIHSLEQSREKIETLASAVDANATAPASSLENETNYLLKEISSNARQENWTRILLRDGIELNVRSPLGANEQAGVTRLIEFARSIFHDQEKGRNR